MGMITPEIRQRFEKVRKLRNSPNAGERAAAEARWSAMVEKYGDPDEAPVPRGYESHFTTRVHISTPFHGLWPSASEEDLIDGLADLMRMARSQYPETQQARFLGRQCAAAITWLMDEQGYEIEGLAGGPWTIVADPDMTITTQQGVIEFARAHGWEGA